STLGARDATRPPPITLSWVASKEGISSSTSPATHRRRTKTSCGKQRATAGPSSSIRPARAPRETETETSDPPGPRNHGEGTLRRKTRTGCLAGAIVPPSATTPPSKPIRRPSWPSRGRSYRLHGRVGMNTWGGETRLDRPGTGPGPSEGTPPASGPRRLISTIGGGPSPGGDSNRSRKRYARSLSQETGHAFTIGSSPQPPKRAKQDQLEPIIFTTDDGYTSQPHSDPVVITVGVANCDINRVLIDGGSSANIIFATVFDELGIGRALLDKTTPPLFAFGGARVQPL
ncbi:unnamed protein product, partial [Prunus brigantina]